MSRRRPAWAAQAGQLRRPGWTWIAMGLDLIVLRSIQWDWDDTRDNRAIAIPTSCRPSPSLLSTTTAMCVEPSGLLASTHPPDSGSRVADGIVSNSATQPTLVVQSCQEAPLPRHLVPLQRRGDFQLTTGFQEPYISHAWKRYHSQGFSFSRYVSPAESNRRKKGLDASWSLFRPHPSSGCSPVDVYREDPLLNDIRTSGLARLQHRNFHREMAK